MKLIRWSVVPVLSFAMVLPLAGSAQAATASPGTADGFAVLAGAGNHQHRSDNHHRRPRDLTHHPRSGPRRRSRSPASTMPATRWPQQAKADLKTAYNVAAAETPPHPIAADLGGQTLTGGVYNSATSMGLTGALTLDGQGDPDAVWVFQAGSTLTTATGQP